MKSDKVLHLRKYCFVVPVQLTREKSVHEPYLITFKLSAIFSYFSPHLQFLVDVEFQSTACVIINAATFNVEIF